MLPPNIELETKAVLKQLARANRALTELNQYPRCCQQLSEIYKNATFSPKELETTIPLIIDLRKENIDAIQDKNAQLWKSYDFTD
jgi:hypothetical protein